jgi:hypothetical protein
MFLFHFPTDSYLLAKSLMLKGKFWVILADLEDSSSRATAQIIKRSYNKFGIFLDYDCPAGKKCIFQVIPQLIPFCSPQ